MSDAVQRDVDAVTQAWPTVDDADLLLDKLVPRAGAAVTDRHRIVDAPPIDVWAALLELDFVEVARRSAAVRSLSWLRDVPGRVSSRIRHEEGRAPSSVAPDVLRLGDVPDHGEWVLLGQRPGVEIAFGAVGRFWQRGARFKEIAAADFTGFDEPGWAKLACSITVRPYGVNRSLVTYETRIVGTDERARRLFARYWRVISPGARYLMAQALAVLAEDAEARFRGGPVGRI